MRERETKGGLLSISPKEQLIKMCCNDRCSGERDKIIRCKEYSMRKAKNNVGGGEAERVGRLATGGRREREVLRKRRADVRADRKPLFPPLHSRMGRSQQPDVLGNGTTHGWEKASLKRLRNQVEEKGIER